MSDYARSVSIKEYAQRHGVSTRTVRRWIKANKLNVIRFSRQTIRIVSRATVRTSADIGGQVVDTSSPQA